MVASCDGDTALLHTAFVQLVEIPQCLIQTAETSNGILAKSSHTSTAARLDHSTLTACTFVLFNSFNSSQKGYTEQDFFFFSGGKIHDVALLWECVSYSAP